MDYGQGRTARPASAGEFRVREQRHPNRGYLGQSLLFFRLKPVDLQETDHCGNYPLSYVEAARL